MFKDVQVPLPTIVKEFLAMVEQENIRVSTGVLDWQLFYCFFVSCCRKFAEYGVLHVICNICLKELICPF